MNLDNYIQSGEISFHKGTPEQLRRVLCNARAAKTKVRLWYGDAVTGRSWNEENDVLGNIGCSTGRIKVLLLLETGQDSGPQLLDHCIVRVDLVRRRKVQNQATKTSLVGETVYQHSSFHTGRWETIASDLAEYGANVLLDGKTQVRFKNAALAHRYTSFMQGTAYRQP